MDWARLPLRPNVCLSVRMIPLKNCSTDLDEHWYWRSTLVALRLLTIGNTVNATLAPHAMIHG
jgi:hypothetical protein